MIDLTDFSTLNINIYVDICFIHCIGMLLAKICPLSISMLFLFTLTFAVLISVLQSVTLFRQEYLLVE